MNNYVAIKLNVGLTARFVSFAQFYRFVFDFLKAFSICFRMLHFIVVCK